MIRRALTAELAHATATPHGLPLAPAPVGRPRKSGTTLARHLGHRGVGRVRGEAEVAIVN
jgi:hypothetical protein